MGNLYEFEQYSKKTNPEHKGVCAVQLFWSHQFEGKTDGTCKKDASSETTCIIRPGNKTRLGNVAF